MKVRILFDDYLPELNDKVELFSKYYKIYGISKFTVSGGYFAKVWYEEK